MSIYPYKTPEVRDLAWACFSPPLIDSAFMASPEAGVSNCNFKMNPRRQHWLRTLDDDPSSLLAHLAPGRSSRLGLYFESLWHFFLAQDEDVELIAHNLPVRDAGRTIGEFDCIYFCRERRRHVHLELAVKFYLGLASPGKTRNYSQWRDWVGPSSRDRLDKKINRLTGHQIKLGIHPASAPVLRSLAIDDLLREIEIKGYLFSPLGNPMAPPLAFAHGQQLRPWLRLEEFSEMPPAIRSEDYQVLPRLNWLSPVSANSGNETVAGPALIRDLEGAMATDGRPRLVAAVDQDGNETNRFFVVGQHWSRE